jgi:hypothetical protein
VAELVLWIGYLQWRFRMHSVMLLAEHVEMRLARPPDDSLEQSLLRHFQTGQKVSAKTLSGASGK